MRIMNNLPALTAFTALNSTNKSLQKTIKSLSTGLRINSASDDAAGFAVSTKMRSQIGGLDVALRNSQDGISLLQTAEGALSQTNDMLQRMRDLSIQASNASLTSNDRQYIQLEIDQLKDEINRIAGTTQFNKKRILDGSSGALWASSDSGVRARVNGGLTYTDKFGQKVSSEGNYRIEVKAEPGQAQVQKSNIYNLGVVTEPQIEIVQEYVTHVTAEVITEIVTETIYTDQSMTHEIFINDGCDTIHETSGDGWEFQDGVLNITSDGTYNIIGTGDVTSNRIKVSSGVHASIFITNVNINTPNNSRVSPIEIESGAEVDLYLKGDNILSGSAGIYVPDGAKITISSASGDGSTEGSLTSTGFSTGIGGISRVGTKIADSGTIIINGGTITARSAYNGAGIGGGYGGAAEIQINGGNVTAYGSHASAGIGGGDNSGRIAVNPKPIIVTITGGQVRAIGGEDGGSGIGGGLRSDRGSVYIKNGVSVSAAAGKRVYYVGRNIGNGGYAREGMSVFYRDNLPVLVPRDIPSLPSVNVIAPKEITREVIKGINIIGEETELVEVVKNIRESETIYKPLSDIPQFYNPEGVSIVSQPQTLTITQGDGQSANITIYATDTMKDVAEKINHVIADTFGHAQRTDNPAKFCTLSDGTEGTSESVYTNEPVYDSDGKVTGYNMYATMLVRSAIPGKDGELYFSGDEDLLNALGLNTIQESSESRFTASVYDAHSGAKVNTMTAEGGEFKSIIPPEIDIDIDPMTTAISSSWDESTKRFMFAHNDDYMTMLHLKDNGVTFQTGANGGEDFSIQLGDMSANALNLSRVNVATRETASRSIGILDRAISRVSSQRAKIGSYINGLEHTMTNLTTTSASLTEAESRIRDADMARTMMDFVRLQILNQSGTSMLSQANQMPRSVLSLLGN